MHGFSSQQNINISKRSVAGPVSGLGTGAAVRLNGIEVGRVAKIELDPDDPKLVTLLLQVRSTIPIHADSVASIESQGLTGVSYVEISGGTLNAPPLIAAAGQRYPRIASRPSSLQEVFNNAPELLSRLLVIGDRLESLLDDKNREAIAQTLGNIRDTTSLFARRSKDIDQLITNGDITLQNLADRQCVAEGPGGQSRALFRQGRPAHRLRPRRIRPCDEACVRSRCSGAKPPGQGCESSPPMARRSSTNFWPTHAAWLPA